jgi:uncharacterized membrane protein YbhN (UPF0104 family)
MLVTTTVGVARRRSLIALTMLCCDPLAIAMTAAASAAGKPGCPRRLYHKIAAGSFSASLSALVVGGGSGYGLRHRSRFRASRRRCSRYSITRKL